MKPIWANTIAVGTMLGWLACRGPTPARREPGPPVPCTERVYRTVEAPPAPPMFLASTGRLDVSGMTPGFSLLPGRDASVLYIQQAAGSPALVQRLSRVSVAYVLSARSLNPEMIDTRSNCATAQPGDFVYLTNFDGLSNAIDQFGEAAGSLRDWDDFALMASCFDDVLTGAAAPAACSGP